MASQLLELILQAKICPYCHTKTEYIDSGELHAESSGMIYICRSCDAYVGVHQGTDKPLGGLANAGLRRVRNWAHDWLNTLYETGLIDRLYPRDSSDTNQRQKTYKWLAKQMNIPEEKCHIGMFDVDDCYRVIDICKKHIK